jgi:hypothetical protein
MASEIPEFVTADLILLGQSLAIDEIESILRRLERFDAINRLHWTSWDSVTSELDEINLGALAKGLVIAEGALGWIGGSVAGAIWVFRRYSEKFRDRSDALAEWMLSHSNNPWVPFGSNRGNARTLQEVKAQNCNSAMRRKAIHEEEEFRKHLSFAKKSVHARLTKIRKSISHASTEIRRELIEELKAAPIGQRLLHIALDEEHPIEFYPVELLTEPFSNLEEVESWALEQIIKKTECCSRGPWRKWCRTQLDPNKDNR